MQDMTRGRRRTLQGGKTVPVLFDTGAYSVLIAVELM